MEKTVRVMMDLIANEVCGKAIDKPQCMLTDEEMTKLYRLSKSHDLAHIVGDALIKNGLIANGELKSTYQKQVMLALYRYEKLNYELCRLREALNKVKISFVPLKGAVIREYYPKPWMRTSCDIDILVHQEQVDKAAQVLVEKLGYVYQKKNYHDVSLMSRNGVHLELHFSIKENKKNIDKLLADCWSYVVLHNNYEYRFSNEFLLFHQLAHASYHFLSGGCGIRPIIDVCLLEKKLVYDKSKADNMLAETGIKTFAEAVSQLAEVWLGDGTHTEVTRRMERFVLSGGVYGNTKNMMAVKQQNERGQLGYILNRIWLPYELLCTIYPGLCGRRYLQLLYEVKRWFKVFDPEVRKSKIRDLDTIKNLSVQAKDDIGQMLHELELL